MHRLKRKFEIAAAVLFLTLLLLGAGSALVGTRAPEPETTAISAKDWTGPPAATAPTETAKPTPAPTEAPEIIPEPEEKIPLYDVPMSDELQAYLYKSCKETGVPFEFALALIGNESDYRPEIISTTNDYGLMQINTCNHGWLEEELGVEDLLDPEENITAGLYILSGYFEKYEDLNMVLMAYNMGENGAQKQWKKGVYQTGYSQRVMERLDKLEQKEDPR
nr:MAG TPA: Transglycosylase SLT domain [Caudoviricetes sp.]